jgi:hypothetical protein
MSTYSGSRRVNGTDHLFDGRLGSYYRGLVPWVPYVIDYNPKIWIQQFPSSGKRVRNEAPRTGYGPTTPD